MDTMTTIYMTYDLRLHINADLDQVHKQFKTADDHKIQIHIAGTIALEMLLEGKSAYIHLHNIYYYPELDFNLLFLEILEKKRFLFIKK